MFGVMLNKVGIPFFMIFGVYISTEKNTSKFYCTLRKIMFLLFPDYAIIPTSCGLSSERRIVYGRVPVKNYYFLGGI